MPHLRLDQLLHEALGWLAPTDPPADLDFRVSVDGVAQDLDKVLPGTVFVARKGGRFDGHDFADEALRRGAVAVVGARQGLQRWGSVPYVQVTDDRWATSALADAVFGHPSRSLTVVGVTGTDGKTTTSVLLHHLLQRAGSAPSDPEPTRASLLSSALALIGHAPTHLEGHFTTPEATEVQAHLAASRDAGARFAVVESSSHGASLQRLAHVSYDLMVWTNLSPEHLDHHGSLEAYAAAKRSLLERAPVAVLNRDDPAFATMAAGLPRVVSFGEGMEADLRAEDVQASEGGLAFTVAAGDERHAARLPMVGRFNVANALAALAAARELGLPLADGVAALAAFDGVPGRMQVVSESPVSVVVDFAHTADALAKALDALTVRPGGRKVVVIGAAGERDPGKRAPLGEVAVRHAQLAILTEEDHRSEDLGAILARMAEGARMAGGEEGRSFFVEPDRRAAMALAMRLAQPGDVVLLAGKGHERTLERGAVTLPWDEAAEARAAIAATQLAATTPTPTEPGKPDEAS